MAGPPHTLGRLLALAACLSIARNGRAETNTSLAVDVTPPGDSALLVGGADARGSGILRARFVFDYAEEPLVLVSDSGHSQAIVQRQMVLHSLVSLALFHRVLVYAALPVATETGTERPFDPSFDATEPEGGIAAGDARFGARVRVLGAPAAAWHLGASLEGRAPTGETGAYLGDDAWGLRALLAAGARRDDVACSFELGFRTRPDERFGGVLPTRVGSAIELGGAVQLPIDRGRQLWLGPEIAASLTVGGGASLFDPRSTVLQFLVGGRYRPLSFPLELAAGIGPGLGQGPGSPDYRVLAGLAWVPETTPPPADRDADGVPDASDVCLNLPGAPSNDPMMHGCPEVPLDSDGDAIPDAYDACPKRPGIATAARRTHGCPKLERVEQPAPPPPAAALVAAQIVINEQIQFETGTAAILPESAAILEAVARVIRENPGVTLVEVAGHTDDTGTPDFNMKLSLDRARAVVEWLGAHGIDGTKLVARGYGQTRPLGDNTTEAGKTANRRVEFHVLGGSGGSGAVP